MAESDDIRAEQMARQRKLDLDFAEKLTTELRSSSLVAWREVRKRLEGEGISPTDAAVGTFFLDDVVLFFGVIAARDGRVFTFDLEFPPGERGSARNPVPSAARLREWNALAIEDSGAYSRYVETARLVMENG